MRGAHGRRSYARTQRAHTPRAGAVPIDANAALRASMPAARGMSYEWRSVLQTVQARAQARCRLLKA